MINLAFVNLLQLADFAALSCYFLGKKANREKHKNKVTVIKTGNNSIQYQDKEKFGDFRTLQICRGLLYSICVPLNSPKKPLIIKNRHIIRKNTIPSI